MKWRRDRIESKDVLRQGRGEIAGIGINNMFWQLLFVVAVLCAIGFAVVGLAAFADAQYRCPGMQCSDAVATAQIGAGLSALCAMIALVAITQFRKSRKRR